MTKRIRYSVLAAFFILFFHGIANAQPAAPTPNYWTLEDRPGRGSNAVVFYGDSIAVGFAFNILSGQLDDSFYVGEPNANLRSPVHVMQLILNEVDYRASSAVYAGLSGLPDVEEIEYLAERLARDSDIGRLRRRDTAILLDAGNHYCDRESYLEQLEALFWEFSAAEAPLYFVLAFDVNSETWPSDLECYVWNQPFQGSSSSMNDLIRSRFVEADYGRIGVNLIDPIARLESLRDDLIQEFGVDIMSDDGIHFNGWGNIALVRYILEDLGMDAERLQAVSESGHLYDHVKTWGYRLDIREPSGVLSQEESEAVLRRIFQ